MANDNYPKRAKKTADTIIQIQNYLWDDQDVITVITELSEILTSATLTQSAYNADQELAYWQGIDPQTYVNGKIAEAQAMVDYYDQMETLMAGNIGDTIQL